MLCPTGPSHESMHPTTQSNQQLCNRPHNSQPSNVSCEPLHQKSPAGAVRSGAMMLQGGAKPRVPPAHLALASNLAEQGGLLEAACQCPPRHLEPLACQGSGCAKWLECQGQAAPLGAWVAARRMHSKQHGKLSAWGHPHGWQAAQSFAQAALFGRASPGLARAGSCAACFESLPRLSSLPSQGAWQRAHCACPHLTSRHWWGQHRQPDLPQVPLTSLAHQAA